MKARSVVCIAAAFFLMAALAVPLYAEQGAESAADSAAELTAGPASAEGILPVEVYWLGGSELEECEVSKEVLKTEDGLEIFLYFRNNTSRMKRFNAECRMISKEGEILDGIYAQSVTAGKDEETATAVSFADDSDAAYIECYVTVDIVKEVPSLDDLEVQVCDYPEKTVVTIENTGTITASGTEVFVLFCDESDAVKDMEVIRFGDMEDELKPGILMGRETRAVPDCDHIRTYVRTVGNALDAEVADPAAEEAVTGTAESVASEAEAVTGTAESVMSEAEAVTGTAESVLSEVEAVTGTEAEEVTPGKEDLEIRELPLLRYSSSADYDIVVTNQSEQTLIVGGNGIEWDADGYPVAAADAYERVVGPGEQSVVNFYFDAVEENGTASCELFCRKAEGEVSAASVLSGSAEKKDNTVKITVKNDSRSTVEFADVTVLFFDAGNQLISSVYQLVGEDYELKPGEENVTEAECFTAFDHYEYYLSGRVTEEE